MSTRWNIIIDVAGAGLAADPPHPLEAELPSPEQLDSTILRAIVSILSSAKKHKETHLLGQITTILTEVHITPVLNLDLFM